LRLLAAAVQSSDGNAHHGFAHPRPSRKLMGAATMSQHTQDLHCST
jgi:hypothetical protein